jgi:hypothetical protein
MPRKRSWLWLLLLALVLLIWKIWPTGGAAGSHAAARAEDPALAVGRVWVDSKPARFTDYVNAFLLVDGAPVGIFQKASAYDVHLELFDYRRSGKTLDLMFLQTEKRHTITYKVTRCDELPPFDLCLTLSRNPWSGNAPRKYYGMREASAEAAALPGLRQRLLHALP